MIRASTSLSMCANRRAHANVQFLFLQPTANLQSLFTKEVAPPQSNMYQNTASGSNVSHRNPNSSSFFFYFTFVQIFYQKKAQNIIQWNELAILLMSAIPYIALASEYINHLAPPPTIFFFTKQFFLTQRPLFYTHISLTPLRRSTRIRIRKTTTTTTTLNMAAITDEQIKEAFTLFDATESGSLAADELALAFKGLGFGDVTAADAAAYIADANATAAPEGEEGAESAAATADAIGFDAFAELVKAKMAPKDSAEEIKKAFGLFISTGGDESKTEIDLAAMLAVAKRLGQKDDEALLAEMIAEASSDKKGTTISFDEFAAVMEAMQGK